MALPFVNNTRNTSYIEYYFTSSASKQVIKACFIL